MKKFWVMAFCLLLIGTVMSVTAQTGETYYVKARSARVRAEATTNATVVTTLRSRTAIVVLEVVEGARVSGSKTWYRIEVDGQSGYIHASLVTNVPPAAPGGSGGGGGSSGQSSSTLQSTPAPLVEQPVAPPSGASCNGATKCTQMSSCDQAYACLAGGNGRLDADHDGIPCESICGG